MEDGQSRWNWFAILSVPVAAIAWAASLVKTLTHPPEPLALGVAILWLVSGLAVPVLLTLSRVGRSTKRRGSLVALVGLGATVAWLLWYTTYTFQHLWI